MWFNHYCIYTNTLTFFQVTGSALRPLTNIPHCCTQKHWVFSDPMWSINFPVTTTVIARKVITFPTTHRDKNLHPKANTLYNLSIIVYTFVISFN